MRILHVTASLAPSLGGPSKACIEMAEAVAARGHAVGVCTTDWAMEGEVDTSGRPVVRAGVSYRTFPVQFPKLWRTSWPLARALGHEIPRHDVVHVHSLYLFHDWMVARLCWRHGVPYVLRPHGTLDPYIYRRSRWRKRVMEHAFQHRMLRRAAAIHYTTEDERALAVPYDRGGPGVVVPLGIHVDDYDDPPAADRLFGRFPALAGRRLVLFLSRLHEKKGLDLLAAAFGKIAPDRHALHLVIAGPDDGVRARAEGWLRAAGVAARTTFTGMLEGPDKLAALAAAEVFVLPPYSENFGVSVLEAMAVGRPVVVSDRVNLWHEIADAGAGLVTPCDGDALAAALARLLDDPARANEMGAAGRRAARERFAWPPIAARLERLYGDVAAGRSIT